MDKEHHVMNFYGLKNDFLFPLRLIKEHGNIWIIFNHCSMKIFGSYLIIVARSTLIYSVDKLRLSV